jgi:two-component system alkaline phosphatase synthesis response regulator PhoP
MTQLAFWIITPDAAFGGRWETLLRREGWQAVVQQDFERFAEEAASARFGIGFLDWDALRGASAEAVRRLKLKAAGVSVILVSGSDLNAMKVIEVLEAGADDHLSKELDEKLLLAKLKAHLRRILPSLASVLDVLKSPGGEIRLDRSKHEARVKAAQGRWVPVAGLTRTEFQLLALFLEQPGKVLERQFILETIWQGQGTEVQPGTVDKHIESLRRKLGRCGSMVKTVYGVGYAFREA